MARQIIKLNDEDKGDDADKEEGELTELPNVVDSGDRTVVRVDQKGNDRCHLEKRAHNRPGLHRADGSEESEDFKDGNCDDTALERAAAKASRGRIVAIDAHPRNWDKCVADIFYFI